MLNLSYPASAIPFLYFHILKALRALIYNLYRALGSSAIAHASQLGTIKF